MSETAKNRLAYQAEARDWTAPYKSGEGVIGAPSPPPQVRGRDWHAP